MNGLDRRALLRGAAAGAGILVASTLAACAAEPPSGHSPAPRPDRTSAPGESGMSTLVVYFSRPGMNYWHGDRKDLEVGNTQVIAEMIAEQTGGRSRRRSAAASAFAAMSCAMVVSLGIDTRASSMSSGTTLPASARPRIMPIAIRSAVATTAVTPGSRERSSLPSWTA